MTDGVIGDPVGGLQPGSPEAWAAIIRVRRSEFGPNVTDQPVRKERPEAKQETRVACIYCDRSFVRTAPGQIWCFTCDRELQALKAKAWNEARRAKAWKQAAETRADQAKTRRLVKIGSGHE